MGVGTGRPDAGARIAGEARLRGWKEIGRWFGADERTVKRWEQSRGLPIHRVPGDARAPVFAYEAELANWLKSGEAQLGEVPPAEPLPVAGVPAARRFPLGLGLAILALVLLTVVAWRGWQHAAAGRQEADERTDDVRRLASSQVVTLSDRLERQPGTVHLRAALAHDAAAVLARVAALPDAAPALREDAAEAYRRLAVVQFAFDRPSLRDRAAARAALAAALRLVDNDATGPGRWLRARILADAARMAAADGEAERAPDMLARAVATAPDAPPALRDELALAGSEVAQWRGDYRRAIALADSVAARPGSGADAALRHIRALDLAAEARFYSDDKAGALAGYRRALAAATGGAAARPAEPAWRWAVQRQQWNVGSTLIDMNKPDEALSTLAASRAGWLAMATADPEDESVASWLRTLRMSYGEALAAAGRYPEAVAELQVSVAERRAWLELKPDNAERRRGLVVGLTALGDALAPAGRRSDACAAYTEASAILRRMTASKSVTRLDQDSMVRLLDAGTAKSCRN